MKHFVFMSLTVLLLLNFTPKGAYTSSLAQRTLDPVCVSVASDSDHDSVIDDNEEIDITTAKTRRASFRSLFSRSSSQSSSLPTMLTALPSPSKQPSRVQPKSESLSSSSPAPSPPPSPSRSHSVFQTPRKTSFKSLRMPLDILRLNDDMNIVNAINQCARVNDPKSSCTASTKHACPMGFSFLKK
jgi:hypothetical protein